MGEGMWIIGTEIGAQKENCLAFIEDLAVTPDQISRGARWQVRNHGMKQVGDKVPVFMENSTMKFHMDYGSVAMSSHEMASHHALEMDVMEPHTSRADLTMEKERLLKSARRDNM